MLIHSLDCRQSDNAHHCLGTYGKNKLLTLPTNPCNIERLHGCGNMFLDRDTDQQLAERIQQKQRKSKKHHMSHSKGVNLSLQNI